MPAGRKVVCADAEKACNATPCANYQKKRYAHKRGRTFAENDAGDLLTIERNPFKMEYETRQGGVFRLLCKRRFILQAFVGVLQTFKR